MSVLHHLVVLLLLVPLIANAQTTETEARRDRMRTFLVVRLADALDLSDEKALEVSKVLRAADQQRRDLVTQRRALERRMRPLLDQPAANQAEIAALVEQTNKIDGDIAMLPENSFRRIESLLTVEQQGRLVLLRPEIQGQIRRNVARRLRERRGGP
jgi:hypothetical protein